MSLTITDLFAGAGGSSTGAVSVPGVEIKVASNHWQKAIDVHNANHPDALHVCADITQIDPRRFPTTDLLWASPECTNHSIAKGRRAEGRQPDMFEQVLPDEAAERSRATMWDVVRFTEAHRYQAVVVENVVEAARWLPFDAWLMAMHSLGYDHQVVYLNSMHAQAAGLPAPQSRDRLYVVFWRKGNRRPDLERHQRPAAWCPTCERVVESQQSWKRPERPWGRYRQQYVYACGVCRNVVEPGWLPAAAAIDWSLPGQRIGDRKKPLADKTRARIAAGIARYWRPMVVDTTRFYDGRPDNRTWPTDRALPTQTTQAAHALLQPFLTLLRSDRARNTDPAVDPLATLVADGSGHGLVQPFIAELRGGGSDARSTSEALATIVASGNHHGLVMTNNHGNRSRPTDESLPTLTTANVHALITSYYGNGGAQPAGEALGTITTRDRHALILRFYGTSPRGGSDQSLSTPVDEVMRALTTSASQALITRHYGSPGDGAEMSTPVSEAMRTLTTTAQQSVVTPGDLAAAEAQVDDAMFRMLEPHEVAAGMAFPSDYIWEGNRRERVRMAGNAVTPPAARDLIAAVVESLTGEAAAA